MLVSDDGKFTLRIILDTYPDCRRDEIKLDNYLGDLLHCKKWQRRLLVSAMRCGIVKFAGNERGLKRLHQTLVDDDGCSEDNAWWAIQEWCEALQVPFPAALAAGSAPAAAPSAGPVQPGGPGFPPAAPAHGGGGQQGPGRQICPQCGTANGANSKFCRSCGTSLQHRMVCPKCGNGIAPGDKFCNNCGAYLGKSSAMPAGAGPSPLPGAGAPGRPSHPASSWSSLQVGDRFTFGKCPQGAYRRIEPIEWLVLRRDSDGLLIVTSKCLDNGCMYDYFPMLTDMFGSWHDWELRRWLNNEFYRQAFTDAERSKIMLTSLHNDAVNPRISLMAARLGLNDTQGADTQDYLFLLSIEEARWLFRDDQARRAQVKWWLRSPAESLLGFAIVSERGEVCPSGTHRGLEKEVHVRPAMKLAF